MNLLTRKSVLAAVVIAAARCGLVIGNAMLIGWPRGPWVIDYSHQLLACVAAATFVVAFAFWRPFVAGRPSGTLRGALAGFAIGIVCHPAAWVLYFLTDQSAPPDFTVLHRIALGVTYSILSLLIYGLFTVLATTLAGTVLGYVLAESRGPSAARSDP